MMQAIQFLSDPAWQRLALTLLHFLWQGLAVTVLAVALVRLLRLRSGPPRYAAYLLALVVMAVCPVVTLCLVKPPASMELPAEPQAIEAGMPRGQERPPMDALAPVEGIEADAAVPGAPMALDAPEDGSLPGLTESAEVGEIPAEAPRSALARYISAGLPWVAAAWVIGVCALSMRLLLGLAGTRRWRRRLESLPRHLAEAVAALSERMGLAGFARVFISTFAGQPIVVGYLRPMVLLPAAMLTQLPPEMLEAVIAHELAHIRRLDVWVNLFQRVMETVLFYHPAVWWLSGRLRWEREFCCDELAVAATGERLTYASALERAYRGSLGAVQPKPALAAGLGAQKKTVLARVRHVLGLMPSPSRSRWWPAGALGLLSLLAVVIGMGVSSAADKPPAKQPATGGSAERPAGASGELSARAVPVFPISVGERTTGVEAVLIEMLRGRIDPDRTRMDHFQIRNPHRKSVDFTSAFRLHVFDDGRRCLLEARITSIRFGKFTAAVILKRGLPLAGGGGLKKDIVLTCPLFSSGTTPTTVGKVDERFRSLIVQAPVSNARLADLVRQHPRVRRIHLHGCRAVTDLSPLGKLPNLADVTMSGCSRLADLSPLRKLNRLARIYLTVCRSLKDLSPLAGMAGLTALHLHGCPQVRDITPVAKLDRLVELSLFNFDGIKDITPLARLTNLRYLNISLADHVSDLSALTGMTGLEVLDAGGLKKLSDISPLAKLKDLRALWLYRTRVKDLSALTGLERLCQLSLSGLEDLVDLKPLAGLTGLRFLDLHDCKSLADLTPLLVLKRLKTLNLKGCDRLTPQQVEAIRKALPQCTITGPAEADGKDAAPAPPATRPVTLPGRPAAELPRLAVHPLAALCRATSQAHVETLGGGLRATVQQYEPIEAIGRMRIAEKFRIGYLVRPGQRPVRRGERVIWVVASAVAGTFRGLCCFEDAPANRKAVKAILKDPGAEKPPAQLIRPKALLLPGSTVPLVEALRESLFIAVCKAGKDDRGEVMEAGVVLHTHGFQAVKFLRGRGVPGKVTIHYTRFELSTLSVGRERRIKEGEVVLWIVGPTDRQRHWRGIKVLADTPANRRVVFVETRRESQILPYAAAQLLAAFVISEGQKGRRPKGATEVQFLPKFFDGLKAKYPELMLVTPDQEKRFAAGQFDDAANKRRAAAAIKALADLGATLPRFAVFLIEHHRAGKLQGAGLEFARRLLEAILAKARDVSATAQPTRAQAERISQLLTRFESEKDEQKRGRILYDLTVSPKLGAAGRRAVGAGLLKIARKTRDADVKWEAIRGLGTLKYAEAAPFLLQCLRDRHPYVRSCAARALGEMRAASASRHLIALLGREKEGGVIEQISLALCMLEAHEAVKALKKVTRHSNHQTRSWVLQAIGKLGSVKDVPFLADFLDDTLPGVPESAARAIEHIVGVDFGFPKRSGPTNPDPAIRRARHWWDEHKNKPIRLSAMAPARGPRTIAEVLATRPAPKLAGLVQRSHPDTKGPGVMEAFWDILMLREAGDQKAVPLLAEILADNAGTGRIHGYAATQALFCIGGKKALVALDKHLLQLDQYNEKLGSMYAFHWDMPEPKRSQYIQAYMLKSIGQDLRLTLDATLEEGGKVRLGFTIRNVSTKPLGVIIPPIHKLYLRSKDGRFLRRHRAHVRESKISAGLFRLKPGETQTATGVAVLRQADDLRKHNLQLPKGVQAVLYMADAHYYIDKPGQHQVVFVLEQMPMTRESQDRLRLENPWSGRAVSKPVPIRLATPTTPPGARLPLAARPADRAVPPDGDPATLP